MTKQKRVFPRIKSDWPLSHTTKEGQKNIGYVKNISLTGVHIKFSKDYKLDPEKHTFNLKLKNKQLEPEELSIVGLKEWTNVEKNEVQLGLSLEKFLRHSQISSEEIRLSSSCSALFQERFLNHCLFSSSAFSNFRLSNKFLLYLGCFILGNLSYLALSFCYLHCDILSMNSV